MTAAGRRDGDLTAADAVSRETPAAGQRDEDPRTTDAVSRETPAAPPGAARLFGDRLGLAEHYVALLGDTGITHGLVGPGEAPRLWERHVLNCAVIESLFERAAPVADIGSGAGLPGIPLAVLRPDLELTLVEPLLRRTTWLEMVIDQLGLDNVTVHRGRAESLWGSGRYRHVTARAVARTAELARIALPLLRAGGSLHAMKGGRAATELREDRDVLRALGVTRTTITSHGAGIVDPETVVLSAWVDLAPAVPTSRRARRANPPPSSA